MTTPQIDKNIGERIKLLRQSRNWTQPMLGSQLGKSGATISYIESGKYSLRISELLRLARIFNVPASNFIEGVYWYERS